MEYVDSWVFNRGQEITLRKGPKMWYASVQLFNSEGHPFKYIRGKDKEKVLLRALELIREDVAKDEQAVLLLDTYHDHETGLADFPILVRSESQELEDWKQSQEFRGLVDKLVRNVQVERLIEDWRENK